MELGVDVGLGVDISWNTWEMLGKEDWLEKGLSAIVTEFVRGFLFLDPGGRPNVRLSRGPEERVDVEGWDRLESIGAGPWPVSYRLGLLA